MSENAGFLPIHIAARDGDLDMVKSIVQDGKTKVDVVAKTEYKETPLILACNNNHLDVFKFLIEKKAKIHQCDCRGFESIFIAAQHGYIDILRYLIIEKKIKPNIKGSEGFTPLQFASMFGQLDSVAFLIEQGANINQANPKWVNQTPLHLAAMSGNLQLCQYLIEHGAKPRVKDGLGDFPSVGAEKKDTMK